LGQRERIRFPSPAARMTAVVSLIEFLPTVNIEVATWPP
jgi:hypothetical protein